MLGFPTQEFGGQEYPTDEEVAKFAASKDYPGILMKLGVIKGPDAPLVWRYFKEQTGEFSV
jgi:glutathione peroxidase-family protein